MSSASNSCEHNANQKRAVNVYFYLFVFLCASRVLLSFVQPHQRFLFVFQGHVGLPEQEQVFTVEVRIGWRTKLKKQVRTFLDLLLSELGVGPAAETGIDLFIYFCWVTFFSFQEESQSLKKAEELHLCVCKNPWVQTKQTTFSLFTVRREWYRPHSPRHTST